MAKVYPEAINQPHFTQLIQKFLYKQQHPGDETDPAHRIYPHSMSSWQYIHQLLPHSTLQATFLESVAWNTSAFVQ